MIRRNSETDLLEGDYIETVDGLFFSVKGIYHPPGLTIAYLRYIPDISGERIKNGQKFSRLYNIEDTNNLLKDHYPQYLNHIEKKCLTLQSIPKKYIHKKWNPVEKLKEILSDPHGKLELSIIKIVDALKINGIDINSIGVSGSVLIGLAEIDSDIDLIVYGKNNGRKAYNAIAHLRKKFDWINNYSTENVTEVLLSRWNETGREIEDFLSLELKKILHGKLDDRDYFIRLIRLPHEAKEEMFSRPLDTVNLRAKIIDDELSIYTPCSYLIEDCEYLDTCRFPIASELFSYRGKFTEQASKGDIVEVRGTLEEVIYDNERFFRVIMGAKKDYMIQV
jgi:predicted nucleotidyltransferase